MYDQEWSWRGQVGGGGRRPGDSAGYPRQGARALALAAGLALLSVPPGCGGPNGADGAVSTERAAIINGTAATAANVNVAFVSATVTCGGRSPTETGSATFLTNSWLLTAAHVVDGFQAGSGCNNNLGRADTVQVQFANSFLGVDRVILPLAAHKTGLDVAMIHLTLPATLNNGKNNSQTGYVRNITPHATSDLFRTGTRCFGFGRSSLSVVNQTGTLRSGDFVVGASPDEPDLAFAVFKGGGGTPSSGGSGIIPYFGDSGGSCVDSAMPPANADLLGVIRDIPVRSLCKVATDCPPATPAATCDAVSTPDGKQIGVCSNNDPSWANIQKPETFRGFVKGALAAAAAPVLLDITGDGVPDLSIFLLSSNGVFFMEIDDAQTGAVVATLPTGVQDTPLTSALVQAFASVDIADFNHDGLQDVFALIGGTPFYFNSAFGAFDPLAASPFNGNVAVSNSEFLYDDVHDVNGDGVDDVELVRPDGTSRVLYGGDGGLGDGQGVTVAPPSYGPDFDGDGFEDVAIGAPGSNVGSISSPGAVQVVFGNGSLMSLFGDNMNGPGSARRDFFGADMVWGNFDGDGPDELAIISLGGIHYWDFSPESPAPFDAWIPAEAVTEPPLTTAFAGSLTVGDFDGDGIDDLLATAVGTSSAFITFSGGPGGLSTTSPRTTVKRSDLTLPLGSPHAGDFNGDGRDDVATVIVDPAQPFLAKQMGFVPGTDSGLDFTVAQTFDLTSLGLANNDGFGEHMVTGNFNGDAYDDLAISADRSSLGGPGFELTGAVFVLYGGPSGLSTDGAQVLLPCCGTAFFPGANDGFGMGLAISHLDDDGYDDLLVGWDNFNGAPGTGLSEGRVFTYRGGPSGLDVAGGKNWGPPPFTFGTLSGAFGLAIGGTATGMVVVGAPFVANGPPVNHEIVPPVGQATFMVTTGLDFGTSVFNLDPSLIPDNPTCSQSPSCNFPTGTSELGRAITGPRPGRSPSRGRVRVGALGSSPQPALRFVGFDDPLRGWTSTAATALNYQQKTQGPASLQVAASGYVTVDSPPFATSEVPAVGSTLSLDVLIPDVQPPPNWAGDLQMFFTASAAGINNAPLGTVSLTGLPQGTFRTVQFAVPAAVRAALLGDFPRARFTIAVNRPAGAKPLLLDNLRFSGALQGRSVFHHAAPTQPLASALFGFESLADWTSSQAGLALDTLHVIDGAAALSIPAAGYTQIRSRTFAGSEVGTVTSRLTLDVRVPSNQQNPSWFGDVQAYFSSPSAGLYNVYLGQVSLGAAFFDEYGVVTFTLPASVVGALGANRTDCQLTLALNAGSNGARYQFDHLAFAP